MECDKRFIYYSTAIKAAEGTRPSSFKLLLISPSVKIFLGKDWDNYTIK